jgi:hypothetical protein
MISWFVVPVAGLVHPRGRRQGRGRAGLIDGIAGSGGVLVGTHDAGVHRHLPGEVAVEFVDRLGDHPHPAHAKTGAAWRDLPERYGPWKTVYNRFWRWSRNGTLAALLEQHPVGKQQGRRPGVGMKATTKVKAQGHQAAEEVG